MNASTPSSSKPLAADEVAYEAPESLAGSVVTSLKWKFGSQIVRETTRLTVAIILARILTPGEWGLASMALVVAALLELVPDAVSGGLVQRSRISERDRSTIFWTALGLGIGVALLGIAASGTIAAFFGEPDAQELIAAVSVGLAITSLGVVPESLLMRDLDYRSLELRHMTATFVGAGVALTLAFSGAGAWAIVGNALAFVTTSVTLLWVFVKWRPSFVFSRASFTSLGAYGLRMFGAQALTFAQLSGDKVLVGRYLGAASLGTYALSFNLMFTPIVNIAFPIQNVLFPAYSTIQDDEDRLRAAWLRGKRLAVAALAPLFLTALVIAPDLVPVVFGSKWEDAIPVLQLLCVAGVAYALLTQNPTLLLVRNEMRTLLRWSTFVTAFMLGAIAVGLTWGVVGVATTYAIARWAVVLPDTWISTRGAAIRLPTALAAACASLPFAAAATGAALLLRFLLVEAGLPAALRLLVVAPSVVTFYVALVWAFSPSLRDEAKDAIRLARRRGRDS
jgi:O-antigen/teichoic acid export membrane protein